MKIPGFRATIALVLALVFLAGGSTALAWSTGPNSQSCDEADASLTWTYNARVSTNPAHPGLVRYELDSECVTYYHLATVDTDTRHLLFMVAPGSHRLFRRLGLLHLGLYQVPIAGIGSAGGDYATPCPTNPAFPVSFLVRADGHVVVDPCS